MVNQILTIWKQLNFFDLIPCANFNNNLLNIKNDIICQCYNSTYVILCDNKAVHIFSKNLECYTSFKAHSNAVELCALSNEKNTFTTLTRLSRSEIQLQFFNLNKMVKHSEPQFLGTAKLKSTNTASIIKTCYIDTVMHIAIAFNNGEVLLHRGSITRDISSNFRSLLLSTCVITGIEFSHRDRNMYICSAAGVFSYSLVDNVLNEKKVFLDKTPTTCCCIHQIKSGNYFVIAQKGAIYYFNCDGRGPCFGVEGIKRIITAFNNYLILIVDQPKSSFSPTPASQMIIIDIENNMITFSLAIEPVINIIIQNNKCYVITLSRELFLLREKDIYTRIRLLVNKHLYDKALRLLHDADNGNEMISNIYLEYGDYLLSKGDIDGATNKYIKTLGVIDPYCVIERLLDSKNNKYLTIYLKELFLSGLACSEHIEMYLHCNDRSDLTSSVERLCYNSESKDICSDITATHKSIDYKKLITFSSLGDDDIELRNFFNKMCGNEIYQFFFNNGQVLLKKDESKFTKILKKLCFYNNFLGTNIMMNSPERFVPILLDHRDSCIDFLENIVQYKKDCNTTVYTTLLEFYLRQWKLGKMYEKDLHEFLEKYYDFMCVVQVLILCKNYSFWKGIVHIYKEYMQNQLCVQYLLKNVNLQNNSVIRPGHFIYLHMWLNTINTDTSNRKNSINFFYNLLNAMLEEKNQSILQVLQTISGNKNVLVLHIKEFFTQEHLQKVLVSKHQNEIAKNLRNDLRCVDNALSSFSKNPIEFRNSICDFCRKQLKIPAVYYLCQHSFHKECINSSNKCVMCESTDESFDSINSNCGILSNKKKTYFKNSKDIINVSISLGMGLFQDINKQLKRLSGTAKDGYGTISSQKGNSKMKLKAFTNEIFATHKEYDANLNPFEN